MAARYFLLMNPAARSYECRNDWVKIFELLRARRVDFDFAFTDKGGNSKPIVQKAINSGFDTIVAVGGDGTINEVINSLFEEGDEKSRGTMGVIYTGTSPDFCRYHQIPLKTEVAINLLLSGRKKAVDVCRIWHRVSIIESRGEKTADFGQDETASGFSPRRLKPATTPGLQFTGIDDDRQVSRVFSCSSNLGLGAAVARGSNSGLRKAWGDSLGTFFSLASAIAGYRPSDFKLKIDGRESVSAMFSIFSSEKIRSWLPGSSLK